MAGSKVTMKIAEVRAHLDKYSREQLQVIIADMYKSIPKVVKIEKDIDAIITNPGGARVSKRKKSLRKAVDPGSLKEEITTFIQNAKANCYNSPNSTVPKKERSKWRFKVKRWYKDLQTAAGDRKNTEQAADLLENLFNLLCYACDYIIFNAYDPFQSVQVEQTEFFHAVLAARRRHLEVRAFVEHTVSLVINSNLNRYTLREDLTAVALEFMGTPDMKQLVIQLCEKGIEEEMINPTISEDSWSGSGYDSKRIINDLVETAFLFYDALHETDRGIELFHSKFKQSNPEIRLYILTMLLAQCNRPGAFLREYTKAVKDGVKPRKRLRDIYRTVMNTGDFPHHQQNEAIED